MTTPITTLLGGVMFSLDSFIARYGRDVIVYRNDVAVTVTPAVGPPTTTQTIAPAPQDREVTEASGASGHTGRAWLVFMGYRGVTGKTNFDVQHGDKIQLDGDWYRITSVDKTTPNRTEALGEALK